jgi:orotate phosphoribosyltransferase
MAATRLADDRRLLLAADLGRIGFLPGLYTFAGGEESATYFEKYLVLSRPGLLRRVVDQLARLVDPRTEVLAARGTGSIMLATALGLKVDRPLLMGRAESPWPHQEFYGETFPGMRVTLVEDVVLSGHRAAASVRLLTSLGVEVSNVLCILDRGHGGRARIEAEGPPLNALFVEDELPR